MKTERSVSENVIYFVVINNNTYKNNDKKRTVNVKNTTKKALKTFVFNALLNLPFQITVSSRL